MALSDRWGWKDPYQRKKDALSFLNGGSSFSDDFNIINGPASSGRCRDSGDCGSGWACNGGRCAQTDVSGSSANSGGGDSSGCGDDSGDGSGGGGGQCAPGTNDFIGGGVEKCLKTGCGDDGGRPDPITGECCGEERCCRFDSYGNVQCFCGNCPGADSTCSAWCDDYLKANGEQGPNCSSSNTCSECEDCRSNEQGQDAGYKCQPKKSGAPCFCDGDGNKCRKDDCEACGEDGVCEEDCETCERCYDTFVECSCGIVKKTCCFSACDQTKGYPECRASIDCATYCPETPEGDGCKEKCTGVQWCDGEQPEPPCPEGYTCTSNGSITVGDRTCNIRTDCGPPANDSSAKLDCNCDEDCGSCKVCINGYCVTDGLCPEESEEPEGGG